MRTSATAHRLPFEAEDALRSLADRVRTVRKARGLTQPDLASKAGISTNTLVTMERGGGSVQLGYWLKVLWALDLLGSFADAVARLGREEGDVALLESQLPQRVRGSGSAR
ncbi:helix-turn-helix domain-containing protein [Piscinibacter sakaiensis]|uniref:helix-turn-helix domain-containing protein n=1 Tax=Piscinibacter sakaiensis TaxID=1547922 RepID=UPI0006B422EF|nr:helix-turn-helix domain-containing protein [Piscinibacter sakaiensis]